jgi:hypothetical protein
MNAHLFPTTGNSARALYTNLKRIFTSESSTKTLAAKPALLRREYLTNSQQDAVEVRISPHHRAVAMQRFREERISSFY